MRPLGPPPNQRENWQRLNKGQRLYAYREWNKARARRNLPNVPFPEATPRPYQPEVEDITPVSSQAADTPPDIDDNDSIPEGFFDTQFTESLPSSSAPPDLGGDLNLDDSAPLFSQESTPFVAEVPPLPDSDEDYPPGNQMATVSGHGAIIQSPSTSSTTGRGAPKRPRTSNSRLPGTAGGGSGSSLDPAGADPEPIPRPIQVAHSYIRHYSKVHRFITWGLAYTPIAVDRKTTIDEEEVMWKDVFMITPLAEFPWQILGMYMNQSDFNLLPNGARVVNMNCKVKCENVRIAFPTNASTSNLATLNQNKFIRVAHGLIQKLGGVNVAPQTFKADQPMVTESFKELDDTQTNYASLIQTAYGYPNQNENFITAPAAHQFGIPQPLKYYYAQVAQNDEQTNSGWPCFQSYCEEVEADSTAGTYIVDVSYKPKLGIIKEPLNTIYSGIPSGYNGNKVVPVIEGTGTSTCRSINTTYEKNVVTEKVEKTYKYVFDNKLTYDLQQNIEKSQHLVPAFAPVDFKAQTCPSLHIGIQPVPALTSKSITNNAIESYTDSQGYFEVVCTLDVECSYPTYRPHAVSANVAPSSLVWNLEHVSGVDRINRSMYHGLYQLVDTTPEGRV